MKDGFRDPHSGALNRSTMMMRGLALVALVSSAAAQCTGTGCCTGGDLASHVPCTNIAGAKCEVFSNGA